MVIWYKQILWVSVPEVVQFSITKDCFELLCAFND
jgi:hypothetical protein